MKFIYLSLLLILIVGCSKSGFTARKPAYTCLSPSCENGMLEVQAKNLLAIQNQTQYLKSMSSCLNVTPSQATQTTYNENKGSLPINGDIKEYTAPAILAGVVISGAICSDLIQKENGQNETERRFFKGFGPLTTTNTSLTTVNAANITKSVQVFARSCFGQEAKQEEIDIVINDVRSGGLNSVYRSALYICTSLLGSTGAQKF